MRYLLLLDRLAIDLSIGLHGFERAAAQRVLVSVALVAEIAPGAGDAIGGVFDYDLLRAHILDIARQPHIELQETLCARIVDYARAQPRIHGGRVRSAKPDVYPDAASVGCQMEWGDAAARALLAGAPS